MKNPFRHHAHGTTVELDDEHEHPWRHMQRDVDPDCVRDPGSDLQASWDLEGAALEDEGDEGKAEKA